MNRELTIQTVRRLAISRQWLNGHFGHPQYRRSQSPSLLDLIRDLGCLQLDPISVVERPHYLIPWSRLGSYNRTDLDRLRRLLLRPFELSGRPDKRSNMEVH